MRTVILLAGLLIALSILSFPEAGSVAEDLVSSYFIALIISVFMDITEFIKAMTRK